jgi:hypothetical protein
MSATTIALPGAVVPGAVGWIQARLPLLFLAYALPAVIVLSVAMAPFQVADELAHTLRADQIAQGKLIADRTGGVVSGPLADYGTLYRTFYFHPEAKQSVALARLSATIDWSGPDRWENFQNTAQYGPWLYAPQAIGLLLGQAIGLTVPQSVVVARLANGLAACLVAFLALRICRRGRGLMFATLLLPMTLSQLGSASQDALLITLSLLAVAVASRTLDERRPASLAEFTLFAAILVATMMARPAQIALALLLPAFVGRHDPRRIGKLLVGGAAAALIAAWIPILAELVPPLSPELSPGRQLALIIAHPLLLPTVMANSFAKDGWFLFGTLVGRLGWLDMPMPDAYLIAAGIALALALIAPGNRGPAWWPGILGVATFVALTTAVCGAIYLSWTPVGQSTINTLQGRYILPALPLLAWPVPAYGWRLERLLAPSWYAVALFPLASLALLPGVIMDRYYGSWPMMAASIKALLLP